MSHSKYAYARSRVPLDRRHRAVVRPVHRRRVHRRPRTSSSRSTRPPRRSWPRSPRPARRTSTAPSRPPAAPSSPWSALPGVGTGQIPVPDRPDHPGALPRAGRAGVARQRQADPRVPRRRPAAGRRALLLLRGLGRQAAVRRLRPRSPAAGRGRPGHPVELPAADAGLEDRARAGDRQHGGAQAGRDDAAVRAVLRRHLPAGRPAAGRGEHRHRRRRHRALPGRAPRRGQGGVHRLDRGGPADRPVGGRHPQAAHPRAGRQGGEHRLRRRADRPGRRGHRQRHLLQPGPRLLRRLAAAGPGVGVRRGAWRR